MQAIRPIHVNGVVTAVNDTVTSTSKKIRIDGPIAIISVDFAASIYIRFANEKDTVTSTNGFLMNAGSMSRITVPGSSHIHFIRSGVDDGAISVMFADSGL